MDWVLFWWNDQGEKLLLEKPQGRGHGLVFSKSGKPRKVEYTPVAVEDEVDEPEEFEDSHDAVAKSVIIEWKRLAISIMGYLVVLFFSGLLISKEPKLGVISLAAGTLVYLLWFLSHAFGIVLDITKNELRFPSGIFRRKVALTEIRDANAEFIVKRLLSNLASAVNDNRRYKADRQYAANISGDFGSRQIRFGSKKHRDRFFSLLRQYVPTCRITRWT